MAITMRIAGPAMIVVATVWQARHRRFKDPPLLVRLGRLARVLVAAVALVAIDRRHWLALPCLLFIFPEPFLEYIVVPFGRPRVAYWTTRILLPQSTLREPRAGAVLNELRARLFRNRGVDSPWWRPFSAALFAGEMGRTAGAATLTARAIVDVLDNRRDDARKLLAVAQEMSVWHAPRAARRYAQAWLLADAAERGAYGEVIRLSMAGPVTLRAAFMRSAARAVLGLSRPSPAKLKALWLCAPARRASLPLLQRALATPRRPPLKIGDRGFRDAQTALLGLGALPLGAATRDEVRRAAVVGQVATDSGEIEAFVAARKEQLHAGYDVRTMVAKAGDQLVREIGQISRNAAVDACHDNAEPALIIAAKDQLQSELLHELESACARLPRHQAPPTTDHEPHWRAWAQIRGAARSYREALPDRTDQLYLCIGVKLIDHGAWLFNVVGAKCLAHDIFRWVLRLGPPAAGQRKVLKRNLRLGYLFS